MRTSWSALLVIAAVACSDRTISAPLPSSAPGNAARIGVPNDADDQGVVAIEVIDHGHGIRSSDRTKIFEPFYTTKSPPRGTGLGLTICYAIVTEHGGRIEVDSVVGEGSVFRILLPARTP